MELWLIILVIAVGGTVLFLGRRRDIRHHEAWDNPDIAEVTVLDKLTTKHRRRDEYEASVYWRFWLQVQQGTSKPERVQVADEETYDLYDPPTVMTMLLNPLTGRLSIETPEERQGSVVTLAGGALFGWGLLVLINLIIRSAGWLE